MSCTLLCTAVAENDDARVTALLQHPETNPNAGLPLFIAADLGYEKCVCALLDSLDIDVNASGHDGFTPLLVAAKKGRHGIVARLLKHPDIQPNQPSLIYRSTPLYNAVNWGHVACVEALLAHPRTDPNATTTVFGVTPLYTAAQQGLDACVTALLRHPQINPNKALLFTMDGGNTPLHAAVWRGHTKCVDILLKHHATELGSVERMAVLLNGSSPAMRTLVTAALAWRGSLRRAWLKACLLVVGK